MSRIAEAGARAGRAFFPDDTWDRDAEAAQALLNGQPAPAPAPEDPRWALDKQAALALLAGQPQPTVAPPAPAASVAPAVAPAPVPVKSLVPTELPKGVPSPRPSARPPVTADPANRELADTMRRLCLTADRPLRSVLFCSPSDDPRNEVAWQAAQSLAFQSGRRVAFVEDGSRRRARASSYTGPGSITRVGWYPSDASSDGRSTSRAESAPATASDVMGETVGDLVSGFDFLVFNATAPTADDLLPLAKDVDGVVVVVTDRITRRGSARAMVSVLRGAQLNLCGVVMAEARPSKVSEG